MSALVFEEWLVIKPFNNPNILVFCLSNCWAGGAGYPLKKKLLFQAFRRTPESHHVANRMVGNFWETKMYCQLRKGPCDIPASFPQGGCVPCVLAGSFSLPTFRVSQDRPFIIPLPVTALQANRSH